MGDSTQDWYDQHAAEYAKSTRSIDMDSQRRRFLALVPPHGRILDMGCGSGRDAHAFLRCGFQVDARAASAALTDQAASLIGQPVQQQDVRDLSDRMALDGIWLFAVLLHIPYNHVPGVLLRLAHALKPHGILHISVKEGTGAREDGGRQFYDWRQEKLVDVINQTRLLHVVESWIDADSARDLDWIHVHARRISEA